MRYGYQFNGTYLIVIIVITLIYDANIKNGCHKLKIYLKETTLKIYGLYLNVEYFKNR